MKIHCLSDTHGAAYKPVETDFILHAGDIYNGGKTSDDMSTWLLPNLQISPGNHDFNDCDKVLMGRSLKSGVRHLQGKWWVAYIGWHGDRFYDLPSERDIEPLCVKTINECVRRVNTGDNIILLTHYPPKDEKVVKGNSEGWFFENITKLVIALNPAFVITGHVHSMFGKGYKIGDVPVAFPGPNGMSYDV